MFKATRRGKLTHIDSNNLASQQRFGSVQERHYVAIGDYFVLHPNHFVLGETLEYIKLPKDLAGYVVSRSSWGRHGLVIATAIGIHPGYFGVVTLELRNLADIPIMLYPGRTVLQLFLHTADPPAARETDDPSAYRGSVEAGVGETFDQLEARIITGFKKATGAS